jgi:hypothetical protein
VLESRGCDGWGEPAALGCEELEGGAVGLEEVEEVDYLG